MLKVTKISAVGRLYVFGPVRPSPPTSPAASVKKKSFFIPAITILRLWKNAITIHVIGNLPLQFFTSLNRAVLYVFYAFGPSRRPAYFRMAQNTPAASLPSTH